MLLQALLLMLRDALAGPTSTTTLPTRLGRSGRRQRTHRVAEAFADELSGETESLRQRATERSEGERLLVVCAVGAQRHTDDGERRALHTKPISYQRGSVVRFLTAVDRAKGQSETAIIVGDGDADPTLTGIETQNSSRGTLTRGV